MTATTKKAGTVTSKDGTRIAYDATGKGPALIVVAGATQFRAFDPSMAVLAGLLATTSRSSATTAAAAARAATRFPSPRSARSRTSPR